MKEIQLANQAIISQLCQVVNQLTKDEYNRKLDILSYSSIGMHVRHILEFYDCLLTGIQTNEICYDKRERQLIYEIDSNSSISKLQSINNQLEALNQNKNLTLLVNPNSNADASSSTSTFLYRELLYTMDHTVHHMALIKIGITVNFPHLKVDPTFGVAPSTIRYQKEKCARQPLFLLQNTALFLLTIETKSYLEKLQHYPKRGHLWASHYSTQLTPIKMAHGFVVMNKED